MHAAHGIARAVVSFALLGLLLGGCSDDAARAPQSESTLAVHVAPLGTSGLTNARYTLAVTNADGDAVWTATIEADSHGDGRADATYVGACDASASPNTVTLTLDALYDDAGEIAPARYANPTPLSRTVACVPNADAPVSFDFTVVRQGGGGFFDIGVDFADVFCSAKLDCVDDDGDDIALLFDPDTGARDMTAVLGFACAAPGDGPVYLYLSRASVVCDGLDAPVEVDVRGLGNVDLTVPPRSR